MTDHQPPKSIKPIRRGPGSLIAGATYPARALWLFAKQPKYRPYILIPILINIVLGITIYAGSLYLGFRLIDAIATQLAILLTHPPQWSAALPYESIPLPSWNLHLPQWNLHLPQWNLHLPQWNLHLPQWNLHLPQFSTPTWISAWGEQFSHWVSRLPNWNLRLPDWVTQLPNWAAIVVIWLVRVVLTVVLLILTGFILLQFGVLLGAPWYGKLSEEIEKARTGQVTIIEVGLARDIGRAILYELKKLGIGLGIGLPLLLLGFFPGVGTLIATGLGITLAATLTCLDFLDSPLERRRLRFRQKLGIVWKSLPASATFGLVCLGLVSIPLINLLAIPLCVAGGTMFVCDRVLPWLQLPETK